MMRDSQDIAKLDSLPEASGTLKPHRIAIVGAGCCGLRIGVLLKKYAEQMKITRPLEVVLFERQTEAGGFLRSPRLTEHLIAESGPQGVLSSRRVFLETLEDLQMTPQDVIVPPSRGGQQARFILTNEGVLAKLSPNPVTLWKSGLVTLKMAVLFLFEFFRFISLPRPTPTPDETLYVFFKRHFGTDWAERIIIPIATGIWGGGAERLLVNYSFPALKGFEQESGSLLRHAVKTLLTAPFKVKTKSNLRHIWPKGLVSFPHGMQTLVERMKAFLLKSDNFSIKTNTNVESIMSSPEGKIVINDNEVFDSVFWTSAPWQTPQLRFEKSSAQALWTELQNAPTHNLIVVNVSGQVNTATRKGFGLLASRQSDGLLGVLFVHSIYETHVPPQTYSYRVLLGGDRNPDMIHWSESELEAYAVKKLSELKLIENKHNVERVQVVKWSRAIGIADADHDSRLSALWRLEALYPQLRFAGIYKKGVGVADALNSAQEVVNAWVSELRPNR